jgi:methyl-accepting chemotaxis protein
LVALFQALHNIEEVNSDVEEVDSDAEEVDSNVDEVDSNIKEVNINVGREKRTFWEKNFSKNIFRND